MLATARTIAQSGFGTGSIWTGVYLVPNHGSQPPIEILGLSDRSERPEAASVRMRWLTPEYLEIEYDGEHQTVTFQAVRYMNVGISVQDTSARTR